jgi:hypothetical protein
VDGVHEGRHAVPAVRDLLSGRWVFKGSRRKGEPIRHFCRMAQATKLRHRSPAFRRRQPLVLTAVAA